MSSETQEWTEIHELAAFIKSVSPDPAKGRNCTVAGCHGKKGWWGVTCHKKPDGTIHYTVNMCCGRVGGSEFDIMRHYLGQLAVQQQQLADLLRGVATGVGVTAGRVSFVERWVRERWTSRYAERRRKKATDKKVENVDGPHE